MRETAVKLQIKDLLEGRYVVKEGWTPNFVETIYGKVSRVNIFGVIIQELNNYAFKFDDGTSQIELRTFEPKKISFKVGDVVMVIGRPREYGGGLYINYEIIKKINPKWVEFRKQELELLKPKQKIVIKQTPKIEEGEEVIVKANNIFEKIMNIIRENDSGDGTPIDFIIEKTNNIEAEKIINNLLSEGEIFEIKPGRVKVLE